MKTKGDTVTCSQAPDLIANMLYQLTIRLPSSGQHAFVESASSKIAASRRTCNNLFHIRTTSLRMNCAGMGGLTTEVTVSRMGYCIIFWRILSMLRQPPRRVSISSTLAGWLFSHSHIIILYGILLPNSDHIVEPGAVVAGHEVGDGVFVQILLDHLLQALPEGEGPAAGHAVAALVAGAETGHGD